MSTDDQLPPDDLGIPPSQILPGLAPPSSEAPPAVSSGGDDNNNNNNGGGDDEDSDKGGDEDVPMTFPQRVSTVLVLK